MPGSSGRRGHLCPVAPLELLAAAAGALLVAAYLPVFQLQDGPLVRALGTGTRGRVG